MHKIMSNKMKKLHNYNIKMVKNQKYNSNF